MSSLSISPVVLSYKLGLIIIIEHIVQNKCYYNTSFFIYLFSSSPRSAPAWDCTETSIPSSSVGAGTYGNACALRSLHRRDEVACLKLLGCDDAARIFAAGGRGAARVCAALAASAAPRSAATSTSNSA